MRRMCQTCTQSFLIAKSRNSCFLITILLILGILLTCELIFNKRFWTHCVVFYSICVMCSKPGVGEQNLVVFQICCFLHYIRCLFVWSLVRSSRCRQIHFHDVLYFTINLCQHHLKTFSFWRFFCFIPFVDHLARDLETKRGPWEVDCGSRLHPKKRERKSKGGKTRGCKFKGALVMGILPSPCLRHM